MRIVRGLLRRLAWPTQNLVVWAPCIEVAEAGAADASGAARRDAPRGVQFVRIAADATDAHYIAADAMRAAGEPDGLIAGRFAHGDEFFGWAADARVVCFGWMTTRDRSIGPFRLTDAPGRVFLYNFHTLPEHRGRGLCTALHDNVRQILGNETASEFVADVNVLNSASRRSLEKSGFVTVARVSFLTLFGRWRYRLRRTCVEHQGVSLFQARGPGRPLSPCNTLR